MTDPLVTTLRIPPPLLTARPTSGSSAAAAAARKPGIFQLPAHCALVRLCPIPLLLRGSSLLLSPARTHYSTLPPSVLKRASLFAPWLSRRLMEAGRMPFRRWFLGSPARVKVLHLSTVPTPASRSLSASRAPFTLKTRARS